MSLLPGGEVPVEWVLMQNRKHIPDALALLSSVEMLNDRRLFHITVR